MSLLRRFWPILLLFGAKACLAGCFSSDFQDHLFIPFVDSFLAFSGNPWVHAAHAGLEFPYPPMMLYLLSPFMGVIDLLRPWGLGVFGQNLLFKLPQLLADCGILLILLNWFERHRNKVLWIYGLSPIVIYGVYLHSQLDLIPTLFLLLSLHFLFKRHLGVSSWMLAVAISTKLHVVIAVPIITMYVLKRFGFRRALFFVLPMPFFVLAVTLPYWGSEFMNLVIYNPKQMQVVQSILAIGNVRLYIPVLVTLLLYGRFLGYRQVNRDLLMAYLGIVFAVFVSLISPAPGWYVWLVPFLVYFWIKFGEQPVYSWLFGGLNVAYLIYFIFFYISDYVDLRFLGVAVQYKSNSMILHDGFFTVLAAGLAVVVATFYRVGLRSNSVYANSGVTVIGIGGDSGSGKSRLKNMVSDLLGSNCIEIEGDGDHRWERGDHHWKEVTHLDPKANFLHRQAHDCFRLKQWKSVQRMDYDHHTGRFSRPAILNPSRYIVLSGLHPFYLPTMRRLIDLKIYLEPQESIRCLWKVKRDIGQRGYSIDLVLKQLGERQVDSGKFIHPQKKFADMVVQFFSDSDFDACNPQEEPHVNLCVLTDVSLSLDCFLEILVAENVSFDWDYDDDMRYQRLVIHTFVSKPVLDKALATIENIEDLCDDPVCLVEGYDGVIQLLIVMCLAHKCKDGDVYGRT